MKKFVIALCIILSINGSIAASRYSNVLDKIENSLYGFTYTTSDDVSRLDRIEESVYGQPKTNLSVQQRIANLNKDMAAEQIGHEIEPKEDTFMEEDDYRETIAEEKMPPAGANVDYPSINELEKKVFKQEFKNQDLNSRLAKLEKQTLGQTYDNDAFSSRVERLQAKIKPDSLMNNSIAQDSNEYFEGNSVPLDKDYPVRINLASVEKTIFKQSFNQDSMDNRLARLESTMFGTTFDTDSESDRLRRISSAYKALKTASKYDSNKFSQNMATAMQIGTLLLMILACVL